MVISWGCSLLLYLEVCGQQGARCEDVSKLWVRTRWSSSRQCQAEEFEFHPRDWRKPLWHLQKGNDRIHLFLGVVTLGTVSSGMREKQKALRRTKRITQGKQTVPGQVGHGRKGPPHCISRVWYMVYAQWRLMEWMEDNNFNAISWVCW